jgi:hypothetical protein
VKQTIEMFDSTGICSANCQAPHFYKATTPAQQAHFVSHYAVFTQQLQAQITNSVCNFYSKAQNNVTQQNKLQCTLYYLQ